MNKRVEVVIYNQDGSVSEVIAGEGIVAAVATEDGSQVLLYGRMSEPLIESLIATMHNDEHINPYMSTALMKCVTGNIMQPNVSMEVLPKC